METYETLDTDRTTYYESFGSKNGLLWSNSNFLNCFNKKNSYHDLKTVKFINDTFLFVRFSHNCWIKEIIYRIFKIQYNHYHYLIRGAKNIHGTNYVRCFVTLHYLAHIIAHEMYEYIIVYNTIMYYIVVSTYIENKSRVFFYVN